MTEIQSEDYAKIRQLYAPVFNFQAAEEYYSPQEIIAHLAGTKNPDIVSWREKITAPQSNDFPIKTNFQPNDFLVRTNASAANPEDAGKDWLSNIKAALNIGANESIAEAGALTKNIGNAQNDPRLLGLGENLRQYGLEGKRSDTANLTPAWRQGIGEQPLLKFGEKLGEAPPIPGDTTVVSRNEPPQLFEQVANLAANISRSLNPPQEPKTAVEKGLALEAAKRGGDYDLQFNPKFFTKESLLSQGLSNVVPQLLLMGPAAAITKYGAPLVGKVVNDAVAAGVVNRSVAVKWFDYIAPGLGASLFGAGEGLQQGASSYNEIYDAVKTAKPEVLEAGPLYNVYIKEGYSPAAAREAVAQYAAGEGGKESGVKTAWLGAPMGALFGKIFAGGKGGSVKVGNPYTEIPLAAGGEAAQEFAQGIAQSRAETKAKKFGGMAEQNPSLAAVNNAVQGAILGGLMGGSVAGITHLNEGLRNVGRKEQEENRAKIIQDLKSKLELPPPDLTPETIPAEPPPPPPSPPVESPAPVPPPAGNESGVIGTAGNLPPVPDGYTFNPKVTVPEIEGNRSAPGYVKEGIRILVFPNENGGQDYLVLDKDGAIIGKKPFGTLDEAVDAVSAWEESLRPKPAPAVPPPAIEEPAKQPPPPTPAPDIPITTTPEAPTAPPIPDENRGPVPQSPPVEVGGPLQPPAKPGGTGSSQTPPQNIVPKIQMGEYIEVSDFMNPPENGAGEGDEVQYNKDKKIAPLGGRLERTGEKEYVLTLTGIAVPGNPAGRTVVRKFESQEEAVKFAHAVAAKEKKLRDAGQFAPLPPEYKPPQESFQPTPEPQSTPEPTPEPQSTPEPEPPRPPQTDFAERFYTGLKSGAAPKDIRGIRILLGESLGVPPGNLTAQHLKKAEEDIEYAITKHARDIVQHGGSPEEVFKKLVDLYEKQPNLLHRTTTSIENQAYSTPIPLAWLADRLAGITQNSTVYEPTAGNGALLIGVHDLKNVSAAEIDQTRVENLQKLGIAVHKGDATRYSPSEKVDAVVANPPFGKLKAPVVIDGYHLGKIDHLIAARALSAMKDGGRAVLILGAQRNPGTPLPASDRNFLNWLYSHYHVADLFDVAGGLYRRQGAGWPVRVITVSGRKTSPDKSLAPGMPATHLNTWREIYDRVSKTLDGMVSHDRPGTNAGTEIPSSSVRGETVAGGIPANKPGGDAGGGMENPGRNDSGNGIRDESGGLFGGVDIQPKPASDLGGERSGTGERDHGVGTLPGTKLGGGLEQPAGPAIPGGRGGNETIPGGPESAPIPGTPAVGAGRNDVGLTPAPEKIKVEPESLLSPYQNVQSEGTSAGNSPQALIPANQVAPIAENLKRLVAKYGSLDEFVRSELGYPTIPALHEALFGIQVDAVAAAIDNAKTRSGMIIADETGLGKGRQAAAMIRWARRQGYTPVFFTASPDLYSDIYRDLTGIGESIAPFFFNDSGDLFSGVYGANGEIAIPPQKKQERLRVLNLLAEGKPLPAQYTAIFSTYSQINKPGNLQNRALAGTAGGGKAFFVLDESHKAGGSGAAGGESNTFVSMKNALETAAGVVYLSATYAKRPDTMPIYFKTGILEAFRGNIERMVQDVASGGLPLQRIISAGLAKLGQLFRRETDFSGIEVSAKTPDFESEAGRAIKARQEYLSDVATHSLSEIRKFNAYFRVSEVPLIIARLAQTGNFGNNPKLVDLRATNFSSTVHNFTKQLLFGFKAKAVAQIIKDSLAAGEKVFVSFENTMERFLDDYIAEHKIVPGEKIPDFGWHSVLEYGLRSSMKISGHDRFGKPFVLHVKREDLTESGKARYDNVTNQIKAAAGDLIEIPASPIDYITSQLAQSGIRSGEITGRHNKLIYENNIPILTARTQEEKKKIKAVHAFNNGEIDVLLANDSGSTGISLHSSKTFKDRRKRRMIIAQPNGDINVFMQIKGRINRVGQVVLPAYTMVSTGLPAETRPLAILSGKLKKLNANTTANSRSLFAVDAPDILNLYGDYIVRDWLMENPNMAERVGLSLDSLPSGDLAASVTGRLAILPIKDQTKFWEEIVPAYNEYVDYLTQIGANELDTDFLDLDAKKTGDDYAVYKGANKDSPFGSDASASVYDIRKLGSKYTADDVKKEVAQSNQAFNIKSAYGFSELIERLASEKYVVIVAEKRAEGEKNLDQYATDLREELVDFRNTASRFWPGAGYHFDFDGIQQAGIVVGIKNPYLFEGKKGNPFALSATRVTFIVNGGVGRITIPLSKIMSDSSPVMDRINEPSIDGMFHESGHVLREKRYIVTGNLTSAVGELTVKGRIVDFTDQAGNRLQGILMPKRFDPRINIRNEIEFLRPEDIINFIQLNPRARLMERGPFGLLKDRLVVSAASITYGGESGEQGKLDSLGISIPGTKKEGGKWFGDQKLKELGVIFGGDRRRMSARLLIDAENTKPALAAILRMTKLYVAGPPPAPPNTSKPTTPGATQSGAGDPQEGPPLHETNTNYLRGAENLNYKMEGLLNVRDAVSKSTIVDFIKKALGIDVRQFATHAPSRNVLGFFSPRTGVTRVRVWGALETTAHEVAHALDQMLKQALGSHWKTGSNKMTRNERVTLLRELGELDYDEQRKNAAEGFAEYIRVWLSFGDAEAKKAAPFFYKYFMDTVIKAAIPAKVNANLRGESIEAPLRRLEKYYRKWYQQGALNRVISQIDVANNTAPESERGIINKARRAWKNIYKFFALEYNDAHGLELLRNEVQKKLNRPLKPSEDAFTRYTVERLGVNKIAETLIRGNFSIDPLGKPLDGHEGRTLVKSLRSILLPLEYEEMTPFVIYGVIRRAADLHERGLVSGFENADIRYLLSEEGMAQLGYRSAWGDVYKDFTAWSDNLLDWAVWGHVIAPETKILIKILNPIWLPFKRIIDDAESSLSAPGGGLKYFHGSGRPIMNPLESVQKVVVSILTKSIRGRLHNTLAEWADRRGVGQFIVEIPLPLQSMKFELGQIKDQLEALGIDPEKLAELDETALMTLFWRGPSFIKKPNTFMILREGKYRLYEVDPDIFKALEEIMWVEPSGKFIRMIYNGLSFFTQTVRLGATGLNVKFNLITNPIRDFFWYPITGRGSRVPNPIEPLIGTFQSIVHNRRGVDDSFESLALHRYSIGMATSMQLAGTTYRVAAQNLLWEKAGVIQKLKLVAENPIDMMWYFLKNIMYQTQDKLQFFELGPRMTELKLIYRRAKRENDKAVADAEKAGKSAREIDDNIRWSDEDLLLHAVAAAKDVTINFTKTGRYGKYINPLIPFYTASVQGPNKAYRALKENPVRFVFRSLIWLTMPSVILWGINKDKEWYKRMFPELRAMSNYIENSSGEIFPMPLPFEMSIFASLPTAILNQFYNRDPDAVNGAFRQWIKTLTPNYRVAAFWPFIDVAANTSWFDRPIEPNWMGHGRSAIPREYRVFPWTTEWAKGLSAFFAKLGVKYSPIQWDYILRNYTGSFANQMIAMDSVILGPDVGGYGKKFFTTQLRNPDHPSRQLAMFFGELDLLQEKHNVKIGTPGQEDRLRDMNMFYRTVLHPMQKEQQSYLPLKSDADAARVRQIDKEMGAVLAAFYDPKNHGAYPFQGGQEALIRKGETAP